MKKQIRFRLGDLNYVAIVQSPLLFALQKWLEKPENAKLVPAVPDWILPASFGVALATLWFDVLFRDNSRLREIWDAMTVKFVVEGLHAGRFDNWNGPSDIMPMSDMGVRLRIRFTKNVRQARLRLRVYSCTGRGRKPLEYVFSLGRKDCVKGEILNIPIVDMGTPEPGWDHTRKRGWGPKKTESLIGKSSNVAIFECQGAWLTQRFKMFIKIVTSVQPNVKPLLYVQGEGEDVFDASETGTIGDAHYDHP